MNIYSRLILSLVFIFTGIIANGQIHNFTNYNVAEGVEQSNVMSITQAHNGMLIYATYGGGVGVYNGYEFRAIKEKQGLCNNAVLAVNVGVDGEIWAATRLGVSKINKTAKRVEKSYLTEMTFYTVAVDTSKKEVWFGSGKGIYKYDQELDSLVLFQTASPELNAASINHLFIDKNGDLWAGTQRNGAFKMTKSGEVFNFSTNQGLSSNRVFTINQGRGDDVFIGTLDGLNIVKSNTIEFFSLPKINNTSISLTTSTMYKGHLVFGAYNRTLYFLNLKDYSYYILDSKNGFPFLKIRAAFSDREGNLWFGAVGDGIIKYNPVFTYFNKNNGLLSNQIRSVFNDAGRVLVGHDVGLNILESNGVNISLDNKSLGFSRVYHINKFKGETILGTNAGLHFLKDNQASPVTTKGVSIKEENVLSSYAEGSKLYFGGYSGLYVFNGDSIAKVEEIPAQLIYSIIKYKGAIYAATDKGMFKIEDGDVSFIGEEQGLKCSKVRSFRIDSKNNLWMATANGVYMFNGKEFKSLTKEEGLTSDEVYLVEIDANGNIWLGSNKGLDRLSIASAYQFWNNNENEIVIRNYGANEGFNGVESNMGAVCLGQQNELHIGTINGMYTYHLNDDKINMIPPSVSLNNIKLNFENVNWSDYANEFEKESGLPVNMELNYNDNNLIFEYVGVSLTNSQAVEYQYKLEGLDENWLPITSDRKAVYTAIPHGDYTFQLKAKNSDGIWASKNFEFKFSVLPPWWKTTWFYTLSVIIVLLTGYIIIVVRTKKLKKAKIELEEKVSERTKELREEKEKVESANTQLAEQKKVVEVVNKNLTDSINYAKKIQEAILPKPSKLEELRDSVGILYLPKDVVSGDFYWFERVGNKLILAAADCTGHGVPGAFMSMIGIDNLNRIVLENKITSPDKILQELNKSIKKSLKQDDEDSESRDGMDIAISCFDLDNGVISYSGAFRPLIYIRNNELFELKASRQPIGGSAPIDFEYELNEFEFKKGDVYYMFSDGYPDQFGGPKGKKFMNKRMKNVFMNIYQQDPEGQREELKNEFVSWMGDNEQIDDILVMCVKI